MVFAKQPFKKIALKQIAWFRHTLKKNRKFTFVFGQASGIPLMYLPSYVDVYAKLLEHLPEHSVKGKSIAYVGSGASVFSRFLQVKRAHAIAFDKEFSLFALSKKAGLKKAVQGNAEKFPLKNLDCIVMHNFFDPLYMQRHCLNSFDLGKQFFNALKPGGFIVIKNPKIIEKINAIETPFMKDIAFLAQAGFKLIDFAHAKDEIAVLRKPK